MIILVLNLVIVTKLRLKKEGTCRWSLLILFLVRVKMIPKFKLVLLIIWMEAMEVTGQPCKFLQIYSYLKEIQILK
jgi:hypothetical protein